MSRRGDERRDLLAERRQLHLRDALVAQRLLHGAQPAGGRQAMPLAREPQHDRPARAPDRAQGDAGCEPQPARRLACELARTGRLGGRAVDRGEHERGLRDAAHERAGELDERSGPRAVVVGTGPGRQIVAPGDEHERVAGAPVARDDAEHVGHRDRAPVGVGGAKALEGHVGAGGAQAICDPVGRARIARAAGRAIREAADELVGRSQRLRAVECRGQRAARQGRRGPRAHEQHERGDEHDEPAGAIRTGAEQRRGPRRARRAATHAREARPALARCTLREHRFRVCTTATGSAAAGRG